MAIAFPVFLFTAIGRDSSGSTHTPRADRRVVLVTLAATFIGGVALGYIHPLLKGAIREALYTSIIYGFQHPMLPWSRRVFLVGQRVAWFLLVQPFLWCVLPWALVTGARRRDKGYLLVTALLLTETVAMIVPGQGYAHYFHAILPFTCILVADIIVTQWWGLPSRNRAFSGILVASGLVVPVLHFAAFPAGVLVPEYDIRQ
jgi:hypothetical protein